MKRFMILFFVILFFGIVFASSDENIVFANQKSVSQELIGKHKDCMGKCMDDPKCVGDIKGSCRSWCDSYCISGQEPIVPKYQEFKTIDPVKEEWEESFSISKRVELDPSFTVFVLVIIGALIVYLILSIVRK